MIIISMRVVMSVSASVSISRATFSAAFTSAGDDGVAAIAGHLDLRIGFGTLSFLK